MKPLNADRLSGEPADQPMGAIYAAVVVVEIVTLLALWWFQTTFGRA